MTGGGKSNELVRRLTPKEEERLREDSKVNKKGEIFFHEGLDPYHIGMKSIKDFWISLGKIGEAKREEFLKRYPEADVK
jgi:hypothetical protein